VRLLRFTGGVSMDFAVIPAAFATAKEALEICNAMYDPPGGEPPARVVELIDELDRMDAIGDDGFLSMWPVDTSVLGAVLCTRWPEWDHTIYTLLEMTRDRGLAMVDLQQDQVFDPRGRVDVEVTVANRTRFPYLTEQIVIDVMDRQDYYGDFLIVEQADETYIQSKYERGELCQVEFRAGSAHRHFQTSTADRSMVPRLISAWLQHGPDAPLLQAQRWHRMKF
jgi:acetolactate synthase regulatory subunit